MNRHSLVSHQVNDKRQTSYVSYDDEPFQGSIYEKVATKSRDMNLQAPVFMLETGSGKKVYEQLY